jgi:hypothetical protein
MHGDKLPLLEKCVRLRKTEIKSQTFTSILSSFCLLYIYGTEAEFNSTIPARDRGAAAQGAQLT